MENEKLYGIALKLLKGIGDATARTLISYVGSAEAVFSASRGKLLKVPGVGEKTVEEMKEKSAALQRAEKELKFADKHQVEILFYYDKRYPKRLLHCPDAPLFLFVKGNVDLNKPRMVNIVGTRHATEYGRMVTEKLVAELAACQVHLVSGLAFGIDICAHKAALKYDMQNIAVLAHGLDTIYPHQHRSVAEKLQENGALISTFLSETIPDKQNFPNRNRIVAGMTDATIVVESAISGGALITAAVANEYNRDVFAFPGRVDDVYSAGCLKLVKTNSASLVTEAKDIIQAMNWDIQQKETTSHMPVQSALFVELDEQEQQVFDCLKQREKWHIDDLQLAVPLPQSVLPGLLLQMEMKGLLRALPGKMYKVQL